MRVFPCHSIYSASLLIFLGVIIASIIIIIRRRRQGQRDRFVDEALALNESAWRAEEEEDEEEEETEL